MLFEFKAYSPKQERRLKTMIKKVTEKELDVILNNQLHVKPCSKCGHIASITIMLPVFGETGKKIKCDFCGCETDIFSMRECFETKKRLATPITSIGLAKGIFNAVTACNDTFIERGVHNETYIESEL